MNRIKQATAICKTFGEGQKIIAAVLELEEPVKEKDLPEYKVKERTITKTYINTCGEIGRQEETGQYVVLELDPADKAASTRYMIGEGREARMGIHIPELEITDVLSDSKIQSTGIKDELLHQFQCNCFHVDDGEKYLNYHLFIPHMEEGKKYPLVLFMHDLGSCSDHLLAPLTQGNGATVWAEKDQQEKRPCFIVAPCYSRMTANDAYEVTWEVDATIQLIQNLCEMYAIDKKRIYGTGQSMGCMMLCEMNLRYPEIFAGSYLVAGQWEPEHMKRAKKQNLWAIVAEKDDKAFPIMGACFDNMERNGEKVIRGHADAGLPVDEQDRIFTKIKEEDSHLYFTWFDGKSVLPKGTEGSGGQCHMNTWIHAYKLETPKEWMFSCKK